MHLLITLQNKSRPYWEPISYFQLPTSWFRRQAEIQSVQLGPDDPYEIELEDTWPSALNMVVISGAGDAAEQIARLNQLARRLEDMDLPMVAVYNEVLKNHRDEWLGYTDMVERLMKIADTISSYNLYPSVYTDEVLGKLCMEKRLVEGTGDIPMELLECFSAEKLGERFRKSVDGVYGTYGFAVPVRTSQDMTQSSDVKMNRADLTDEKPDGTVQIRMYTLENGQKKEVCLSLPDSEEKYKAYSYIEYGDREIQKDGEYKIQACECLIPQLDMVLKKEGDFEKWNEFAKHLEELEASGQLLKYVALLSMKASETVDAALALADTLDMYEYHQDICSAESYARGVLKQAGLDVNDLLAAEMRPYRYGEILIKKENIHCCTYGMIRLKRDQALLSDEKISVQESGQTAMEINM